jgi:hypothetical protein
MMEYSSNQLKQIQSLGMLGYDYEKCANVMEPDDPDEAKEFDRAQLIRDLKNPKSTAHQYYKKGWDKGQYQIDLKLYNMAMKEGNMKALEKYEQRQAYRNT